MSEGEIERGARKDERERRKEGGETEQMESGDEAGVLRENAASESTSIPLHATCVHMRSPATYLLLLPGLLLPLQIHGLLGGHGPATRRVGIRLVLRIANMSMPGKPCTSRHCDKRLAHHHRFYSQSNALAPVDHLRCDRSSGCRRHAEAELLFPGVLVADSPDL